MNYKEELWIQICLDVALYKRGILMNYTKLWIKICKDIALYMIPSYELQRAADYKLQMQENKTNELGVQLERLPSKYEDD